MSSLRNAVQRRQHRERAQPFEREKLGLLEKHKDYSLRAKDFAAKKARLRVLRQKATDRNPDEFHFAMMSSRVGKDGAKVSERGNKSLSAEVVKLLKTQDAGYLKVMATQARKERERLEEQIQLIDAKTEDGRTVELRALRGKTKSEPSRHKVFVDSDQALESFNAEVWFDTDSKGLHRAYNRPRKRSDGENEAAGDQTVPNPQGRVKSMREKQAEFQAWKEQRNLQKKHDTNQQRRRERLDAVRSREQSLLLAEQELALQRAQMSNNAGGINKNGVRFKRRDRKK